VQTFLFISADAAQGKENREENAAAHWCFKVCSPCSTALKLVISYCPVSNRNYNVRLRGLSTVELS
jgi:hypothetical protein